MKILILTVGSRGDVQPYLALAKGLSEAGHVVSLCTCERFRSFIEAENIGFFPIRNDILDFVDSAAGRSVLEDTTNIWRVILANLKLMKTLKPVQRGIVEDCWSAVKESLPDLLIYHPKAFGTPSFAELNQIPVLLACPFPAFVPTGTAPNIGFPQWRLGQWYNRLTYYFAAYIFKHVASGLVNEWRQKEDLPRLKNGLGLLKRETGEDIPVLHLYSEHVSPKPVDWPPTATVTGYCFLEREKAWVPPKELQDFLDAGDPPVYVGFGSMVGRNPKKITDIILEALGQANCRGILATSWGGLEADELPDTVFMLGDAPHDWLFPRMSAVVHHGGAGTTAAGLRAGKPTIICSFFGDQPFWGRRVQALGVGIGPLPQKTLTAEQLAKALREVTTDKKMHLRAEEIGAQLHNEDGISAAIRTVEAVTKTGAVS